MTTVKFYGGPLDGMERDFPFLGITCEMWDGEGRDVYRVTDVTDDVALYHYEGRFVQ